jgi:DUF4097 and DUF4098 domain-containing protein YvlB
MAMPVFDTPGAVELRIEVQRGQVEIESAETASTEVEVVAPGRGSPGADAVQIRSREREGVTEISVVQPRKPGLRGVFKGRLHVTVRCPHGAAAHVATDSADVALNGRYGDVALKTGHGDISLDVVEGACKASTASGDNELGEGHGPIALNTASGDIHVGLAAAALSAGLVSGDLDVRDARGGVTVRTVSGDVRIEASLGDAKVQAVSGDIHLGVREGQRLWIDASSVSGSLRSELEPDDAAPAGDVAVGELTVRSVSGDIAIVRAAAVQS